MEEITQKKCIEFAIGTEENGARFYNLLAGKFTANPEISELFKSLAKDEKVHRQQFAELLKRVPEDISISNAPEKHEYVKAMSISEFFSHRDGPFKDADKIENKDDALKEAFDFEKATLGFYQAVEDAIGNNPALTEVIEAEKGHLTRLMKVMVTGGKFRSLQDKWP